MITRRSVLVGLVASPAIVRYGSLMPVRSFEVTSLDSIIEEAGRRLYEDYIRSELERSIAEAAGIPRGYLVGDVFSVGIDDADTLTFYRVTAVYP